MKSAEHAEREKNPSVLPRPTHDQNTAQGTSTMFSVRFAAATAPAQRLVAGGGDGCRDGAVVVVAMLWSSCRCPTFRDRGHHGGGRLAGIRVLVLLEGLVPIAGRPHEEKTTAAADDHGGIK